MNLAVHPHITLVKDTIMESETRPNPLPRVFRFTLEKVRSDEISSVLKEELEFAVSLFRMWVKIDLNQYIGEWHQEIDQLVIDVSCLLHLQTTRLYRSVIEEAIRGVAISGVTLARTMFETTLALWFVSKEHVGIEAFRNSKNNWSAKPGTNNLDRLLRARLYIHSHDLAEQRFANNLKAKPDREQIGKNYALLHGELNARDFAEAQIGKVWIEVLENKRHYSGLNVEQLAQCLDPQLSLWYDVVYRLQSFTVHANDALRLFRVLEDGKRTGALYSQFGEIRFALYTATGVFLTSIAALNNHFGLGAKLDREINELWLTFNSKFGKPPLPN